MSRPLNGKSRMTPDEKRARRRELDRDPARREQNRRNAAAWRARHRDELNRRRREQRASDPDFRARENARHKAYREAHPDRVSASFRRWASKNRDYLRRRQAEYDASEAGIARNRRKSAKRKERMAVDAEYREHVRAKKRENYQRWKKTPEGKKWYRRYILVPTWERVVAEGPERIARYLKRAGADSRRRFMQWYSDRAGLINMTDGLGKIVPEEDGEVASNE